LVVVPCWLMAGLYIHIPFCKQACYYCDFHFSTDQRHRSDLIVAIAKEIELQKNYLNNETLRTIYFGGGTPSLCSREEISFILETIYSMFPVGDLAEVTLEANPDDLSNEKLLELKKAGINRLSIGVQSFDDDVLRFLNRAHSSAHAAACLRHARSVGFENISLDLIYAIPDQNTAAWRKNVEEALSYSPEHVSSYSLTIEEKTVFGNLQNKGRFPMISEDVSAEQFEVLMEMMDHAQYDHYEISNFSKPGYHSRHNSSYWQQENYLGIGPSAHSYNGVSRQANVRNNTLYTQAIHRAEVPFEREELTRANQINEYILTTLRTSRGADLEKLNSDWHFDLRKKKAVYLSSLVDRGYASVDSGILKLTRTGKLLADKIAVDLFSSEE
jgi:oxygen-independent coproporphyrinogen-3 oxidase